MTPRRLLPLLAVLALLAAAYFALTWRQDNREKAEQTAKRLFAVKIADITEVTLKKGAQEIHLAKKDQDWHLTKPLNAKADPEAVQGLLSALAYLDRERDLGQEQELKTFGLDNPAFVVSFVAQGKPHTLSLGNQTPGELGYYALKDQERRVLVITPANKESLDRPLAALRDKTLFHFSPAAVQALKIQGLALDLHLKRTGPAAWRWEGWDQVKVRHDRVETLMRGLTLARVKEFSDETPRDLARYGLAPQPALTVTVQSEGKGEESLLIGGQQQEGFFARRGAAGPVFLLDADLVRRLREGAAALEDRRLWSGDLTDVHRLAWGHPDKLWNAVKDKDFWKLTGPGQKELRQPAVRLEIALLKLQELEYDRLLPERSPIIEPPFLVQVMDGAGKMLFRLEETSKEKSLVAVRLERNGKHENALITQISYEQFQGDLNRLTQIPQESGRGDPSKL